MTGPASRRLPRPLVAAVLAALLSGATLAGCNRNIEPFDPNEKPHQPDLSKIFPEGAEEAKPLPPGLPPPPGEARGGPAMAQAQAQARAGGDSGAGSDAAPIEGRVEVAPGLGAGPSGAVLFVIARRGSGGPPLAVKRIPSPTFPVEFRLGPDDRMIKAMPFAGPIRLSARLDADGNAMSRSPGDLQGAAPDPVEPGATGVVVRLDTRL